MQLPLTKYLHRCKRSQLEHTFFWQSPRLVLATTRLSGRSWPSPWTGCLPSRIAILPSSKRMDRRSSTLKPKLLCASSLSCSKSRHPWLSHRIPVINLETSSILSEEEAVAAGYNSWQWNNTLFHEETKPKLNKTKQSGVVQRSSQTYPRQIQNKVVKIHNCFRYRK